MIFFFFFNDTATTEIYTLSLHDALPISVLADTGAIANRGNYLFAVSGAGSIAWTYDIQHRDGSNTTNVHSQRRRPAAGNDDILIANKIFIDTNERVRVLLQGATTGEIQMSIFYVEVG